MDALASHGLIVRMRTLKERQRFWKVWVEFATRPLFVATSKAR
jgi:hypothetical protein